MNAAALIELLAAIGTLLNQAKAEGRDVTVAELDALTATDAAARARLQAAIDAANGTVQPAGAGGPGEEKPTTK